MKKTAPRIEDNAAKFIAENFKSLNSGCEHILNSIQPLFVRSIGEIKTEFSDQDIFLIKNLSPKLGVWLYLDRMVLEFDEQLSEKINSLTAFEKFVLEIYVHGKE